jgi:hypothetical protein
MEARHRAKEKTLVANLPQVILARPAMPPARPLVCLDAAWSSTAFEVSARLTSELTATWATWGEAAPAAE